MGSILYSCNNPNNSSLKKEKEIADKKTDEPAVMSTSVSLPRLKEDENPKKDKKELTESSVVPIQQIVAGYLSLKNALTQDDAKKASVEAQKLYGALKKVNISKSGSEVKDILESAAENAEHISENSGDIGHQREHLLSLSNDITDLIEEVGTGGLKLYQDFCPMYNNGKGGIWISESEEIINPYEGQKMSNCGSIKKIL